MGEINRARKLSEKYLRFHKQLRALQAGQIKTVKRLAADARAELSMKSRRQLSFSFKAYKNYGN